MDGSVLGPKLAEFEQVAAARRVKSSRENPLQCGAKRDIASWQWDQQQRKRQQSVSVDESVTTSEDDLENNTE